MKNFTSTYNRTPIMCSIDRRTGSGVHKGIKPRLYCQRYLQCSEINLQSNNSRELPIWDCTSPWSIDSQIHSLYFPSSTWGEMYPQEPQGPPRNLRWGADPPTSGISKFLLFNYLLHGFKQWTTLVRYWGTTRQNHSIFLPLFWCSLLQLPL